MFHSRMRSARAFGAASLFALYANAISAQASAPQSSVSVAPTALGALDDLLAVPDGLTANDVVVATLQTSPARRTRAAELDAARAEADRAWLALVPRVGISASYTRLSPIDAPSLGFLAAPVDQTRGGLLAPGAPLVSVGLAFPVVLDQTAVRAQLAIPVTDYFLRVLPSIEATDHVTEASVAASEATDAQTELDARIVFWGWARARLGEALARQALVQSEGHRDDAERLFRSGAGTEADVSRAEAQVAGVRETLASTQHMIAALEDRLRTITARGALPQAIGEPLPTREASLAHDLEQVDDDVAVALRQRAEMRALREQIEALESQRLLTDAAAIPRIDLVGEVLLANPNPRFIPQQERFDATWAVGAQLGWQLNDALTTVPQRRALEARIAAASSTLELVQQGLRAEVIDAHRLLADAETAMHERHAQVEAAEHTVAQATALFRAGQGTGLGVIDAQTLATRSRLTLLDAHIDYAVALARRNRALGHSHN